MKITAIETHVCHARMRNWVFVKVVTDQDGLWGWGEATLEWHTRAVVGAIEDIAQLLIGEDPTRIEHLWQMMYRQHFWHGNGIVRGTAISGIDIALWDILGKIHGVPCHKLWGGPVRDYIRTYCHLGGGKMEDFYVVDPADAPRFAELALRAVDEGFTAFKSMAVPATMPIEGLRPIRYAEACVRAMREAVGDDIDIMVDCHARPSPRMGLMLAKALEPYGFTGSKNRAGRKAWRAWPTFNAPSRRPSPPASGWSASTRFASCWNSARAASCSPTSRTAAA